MKKDWFSHNEIDLFCNNLPSLGLAIETGSIKKFKSLYIIKDVNVEIILNYTCNITCSEYEPSSEETEVEILDDLHAVIEVKEVDEPVEVDNLNNNESEIGKGTYNQICVS